MSDQPNAGEAGAETPAVNTTTVAARVSALEEHFKQLLTNIKNTIEADAGSLSSHWHGLIARIEGQSAHFLQHLEKVAASGYLVIEHGVESFVDKFVGGETSSDEGVVPEPPVSATVDVPPAETATTVTSTATDAPTAEAALPETQVSEEAPAGETESAAEPTEVEPTDPQPADEPAHEATSETDTSGNTAADAQGTDAPAEQNTSSDPTKTSDAGEAPATPQA